MDNSAILGAFDLKTGKELWTKRLGTLQKGSPVLADGKLYVGTENGKFYILRPTATGAEVLDEDLIGTAANPEPIVASPAIADGRIYVTTMSPAEPMTGSAGISMPSAHGAGQRRQPAPASRAARGSRRAAVAQVQVFPYEALLDPGGKQAFTLKLYDAKGNFIRTAPASEAQWTLDLLRRHRRRRRRLRRARRPDRAGFVKATVGGVTGQARVRVIPPLPWTLRLRRHQGRADVVDVEPEGRAERPWTAAACWFGRATTPSAAARRFIMGRPDWSNYTVEADVRGTEMRRQRGDVGLINQRYALVLFGNGQQLEMHPWQAADEMTVRVDTFAWDAQHLVSHEAARGEPSGRHDARAGQGLAARPARAGRVDDSRRSTRSAPQERRAGTLRATASRT